MNRPAEAILRIGDVQSCVHRATGVRIRILGLDCLPMTPSDPLPLDDDLLECYEVEARNIFPLRDSASVHKATAVLRWIVGCDLDLLDPNGDDSLHPDDYLTQHYDPNTTERINRFAHVPRQDRWHGASTSAHPTTAQSAPGSTAGTDSSPPAGRVAEVPYQGDEPYLFLSRAKKDEALVGPLRTSLLSAGVRLWWDGGIAPGDDFSQVIQERLSSSVATIVILSGNSMDSTGKTQWVLAEARTSVELGHELLPVRIDESPLPIGWSALVGHRHIIDAKAGSIAEATRRIADRVRAFGAVR